MRCFNPVERRCLILVGWKLFFLQHYRWEGWAQFSAPENEHLQGHIQREKDAVLKAGTVTFTCTNTRHTFWIGEDPWHQGTHEPNEDRSRSVKHLDDDAESNSKEMRYMQIFSMQLNITGTWSSTRVPGRVQVKSMGLHLFTQAEHQKHIAQHN